MEGQYIIKNLVLTPEQTLRRKAQEVRLARQLEERLSKDEIEKMVEDAEKFKKDDEAEAERLKGKLSLEAYCLDLKSAMENKKLDQDKIVKEKKRIVDKCNKAIKWIGKNKLANKEEYEDKEKEVKAVCDPIITALFKDAGLDDNGR